MEDFELKQVQEYLNKKFNTNKFVAKKRTNINDSFEIYLGNEFIGLIYIIDDEGEVSYQFQMTILNEDLLDA